MNQSQSINHTFFPQWLTSKSIGLYFVILLTASAMFFSYALSWYWILAGVVEILGFFYFGNSLSKSWHPAKLHRSKAFEKRLFWSSFAVRFAYVLLIYTVFMMVYDDPFGFENMDATYYDDLGKFVSSLISDGNFHFFSQIDRMGGGRIDLSDMGYGTYLGFLYYFTANSVLIVRLLKCVLSAFTCVLIYRLARRNFDEETARLAGIFCMLWPNFWYYCGCQLKEVEMVFLCVLFVEQADQMLRSRKITFWKLFPVLLIAAAMFTVRTPLAVVMILALLFTIVMFSTRVVSWGKRILIGLLAVALIGVTMGNRLQEEAKELVETVQSNQQATNMEWRAQRENGNSFAKYAGAAVFAPLIFTIPFPTMVETPQQELQKLLHGGNFVKNVMSGVLIFAMFALLLSGDWRKYMLPLSLMLGYLVVLVLSEFAQSERFHQPAMPFEFMFMAYGIAYIQQSPKRKQYQRWFYLWMAFVFVANIGWQWFKLAGRGMA